MFETSVLNPIKSLISTECQYLIKFRYPDAFLHMTNTISIGAPKKTVHNVWCETSQRKWNNIKVVRFDKVARHFMLYSQYSHYTESYGKNSV